MHDGNGMVEHSAPVSHFPTLLVWIGICVYPRRDILKMIVLFRDSSI
jgi:hypothetical protein